MVSPLMKKDGGSNEPAKYQPAAPEGKGFRQAEPGRLRFAAAGAMIDRPA
jgi:hypothetical protein